MCILELVDFNEAMKGGEAAKTKDGKKKKICKKEYWETEASAKTKITAPVRKRKVQKTKRQLRRHQKLQSLKRRENKE